MKVDILAFAAHPDDIEISCAGTLIKSIREENKKVAIVDLTQGELGTRGTIETRYSEAMEASRIIGISRRVNLKLPDGFFRHDEESLRLIIEQIRFFQPEIVLANSITDRHPDHGRASKLVSEACFYSGLRKIETTFEGKQQEAYRPKAVYHYIQDRHIEPDFVVDISKYAEEKMNAILAYKTQFYDPESTEPKTPISGKEFKDFLFARMREFGRPVGVEFAEGFTKERYVGVKSLFDLV
ncbi:MAG: bacillithiol biosynthesis deacetylase BshB1 [Flavobacteriia bacterium]|nr:bacillithiol biosynthesis deacetylase BshB1 [Flavobacteriia bacterium]OJX37572.1 MAG: bacillithiol biosynthesis deacetylase BshB1 [Flavobacteriia bacterium 40-80]